MPRIPLSPIPIVQRDDGFYEIGIGDNPPGPFETYTFASAVAAREVQRGWARQ
jgi:hypothetical protein